MQKKFKKKIQFFGLVASLSLLLSACSNQNKGSERLVESLAGCINPETTSHSNFQKCLLEQFVLNPASETMPEDLIFEANRDAIINIGYDKSERRSHLLKKTAKIYGKKNHGSVHNLEKKFAMHDVFYSARSKTVSGTQSAIAGMNEYKRTAETKGVRYYLEAFDDLMKTWIDNPDIFSPEFVEALADHFYDQDLFPEDSYASSNNGEHRLEFFSKTRRLIRLEREWGILPQEALSRAYEYAGAPKKGQNIKDIFGRTKKGRLQAYLGPVRSGRKLVSALDLETLKSMDFTTRDLLPILRHQMESETDSRVIFRNLAYAIHHGGIYVDGGNDSDSSLKYAYKRGDIAAIKMFADLLIRTPVPLDNDTVSAVIRGNMLGNDLAVSRYLSAEKDMARVKKLSKKWSLYLRPRPSNKNSHPVWAGTSIDDFVKLAYLAEDYDVADQYLQYLLSKKQATKQDISKLHFRAALNTANNVEKLNEHVDVLEDFNVSTKKAKGFYTKCQKWSLYREDEKFKNCVQKLKWKPSSSVEDARYVISNILSAASTQYKQGQLEKGRELFILGLERAAACKCQRDPNAETLGHLIAQDINLSSQATLELKR